jgi:hypothetical protein
MIKRKIYVSNSLAPIKIKSMLTVWYVFDQKMDGKECFASVTIVKGGRLPPQIKYFWQKYEI